MVQTHMNRNLFHRLLRVLAGSSENDLRRQIQYLKAENEILRSRIDRQIRVTPAERHRLMRLAKPLGAALKVLVTIVKPDTVLRWIREADRKQPVKRRGAREPGRPRTADDIRELVIRIARETGWGYTRILGELRKLDIKISRGTVVNILREAGLPTGPQRGETTWDQFIKAHAKTLWACDFIQQRIVTLKGFRDAYLLVLVNVATRRAIATTSTEHPNAKWITQQVTRIERSMGAGAGECRILTRDADRKFGWAFERALGMRDIKSVRLPHRAPNLNAHVERFIQTVQTECLDRFIVMGTSHLDLRMAEYIRQYNRERPHSAIEFQPPASAPPLPRMAEGRGAVSCRTRLGGVLRHYYRATACSLCGLWQRRPRLHVIPRRAGRLPRPNPKKTAAEIIAALHGAPEPAEAA